MDGTLPENLRSDETVIRVVGVGGGGGNAVNRMIESGAMQGVEFIAVNTDAKDLLRSEANIKISLSDETSRGLGAGADPERGSKAAQDHQDEIEQALKGSDMVFVTCGEGGGTGTGASPVVAHIARELGALTVAVVTRPFSFEGPRRAESADSGIEKLRKEVDAIIIIPNDRLLSMSDSNVTLIDAFKTADSALNDGVGGITFLVNSNSYIDADFNDIKAILKDSGTALFGVGQARGDDRAVKAAELAISSPLLEESIEGAHGVLINIASSMDVQLSEVSAINNLIFKASSPEAQIIWGQTFDDALGDELKVTVIAAGFDEKKDSSDELKEQSLPFNQDITDAPVISKPAMMPHDVPTLNAVHLNQHAESAQPVSSSSATTSSPSTVSHLRYEENQDEEDATGDIDIPPFLR
ncbi:MAG: cell division protein FtsZ [Aeriscardovia sp.]|nr:cell division protein FtsZ [Aeriscardovia sp.]